MEKLSCRPLDRRPRPVAEVAELTSAGETTTAARIARAHLGVLLVRNDQFGRRRSLRAMPDAAIGVTMKCSGLDFSKMRRIAPGIYSCEENHCHIDAAELLTENGYPPTMANQNMLEKALRELGHLQGIAVNFEPYPMIFSKTPPHKM